MKKITALTLVLMMMISINAFAHFRTLTTKMQSFTTYSEPQTMEVTKEVPCYFSWTHSDSGDIAYQESPKSIWYEENGYRGELTYISCDNSHWQDARDLYIKQIVGFNIVYIGMGTYKGTVTKIP